MKIRVLGCQQDCQHLNQTAKHYTLDGLLTGKEIKPCRCSLSKQVNFPILCCVQMQSVYGVGGLEILGQTTLEECTVDI